MSSTVRVKVFLAAEMSVGAGEMVGTVTGASTETLEVAKVVVAIKSVEVEVGSVVVADTA